MSGENRREVILKGGKGGLGNMHFATSTMQVRSMHSRDSGTGTLGTAGIKIIADVDDWFPERQ